MGRNKLPDDKKTGPYTISLTKKQRLEWKKKAKAAKVSATEYAKMKMEL